MIEPAATTDNDARVVSLDMLRGVLALSVAVYHFFVVTRPFTGVARDLVVVAGIYAVQTFFILSGFCFFHIYAPQRSSGSTWGRFALKRFFRIAPLYYVAAVCSALLGATAHPQLDRRIVLENLTLSFGLFHPNHAIVHGGWSIGIECVFYLVLPLLLWLTRRPVALYAVAFLLVIWAAPFTFQHIAEAPDQERFHQYVQIPNHAFLFLLGGAVADIRRRTSVRLSPSVALLPIALFGALVAFVQPTFHDHVDVMVGWPRAVYVTLSLVVVLVVALVQMPTTRRWQPLRTLGDWSYSVYLAHPLAWIAIQALLPSGTPPTGQLVAGVIATLAVASLTYRYIERPANDLGRRLAEGTRRSRPQHLHAIANAERS